MTGFTPHADRTGPQFRVYVIEVQRLTPDATFDFYVGSTGNYLRERWANYEQNKKVSKHFRNGHVQALDYRYDLMQGWGPYMTRDEAEKAEGELAYSLKQQGLQVYSDRLKFAEQERKAVGAN